MRCEPSGQTRPCHMEDGAHGLVAGLSLCSSVLAKLINTHPRNVSALG